MKNKPIIFLYEEAKAYKHHYRPSLNFVRFFKSIIGVFISGSSPAAQGINYNRKRAH